MSNNLPNKEEYEKISEWLDTYHSISDNDKRKEIRSNIVSKMFPVVKHIAKTIARRSYDPIDDLVQAGSIGLLRAIDKYQKEINDNFRVYAGYFIIGEMKHYLRDKLNMIRVPAYVQELTIRINNFTSTLTQEELLTLTSDEVASALEVSTKQVDFAMQMDRRKHTVSLEDVFKSGDDSMGYEEILASDDYKERLEYADAKIIFNNVFEKLPVEERLLLEMYYKRDMSQKEIAATLKLTPVVVSRKIKKVFELICNHLWENSEFKERLQNDFDIEKDF